MNTPLDLSYRVSPDPKWKTQIEFQMAPKSWPLLADRVEKALSQEEVRVALPSKEGQSYLLFFKIRTGDSRIMFAHPDTNEWVVTVALEKPYYETFLKKLRMGQPFKIEAFCPLNRISNGHLAFT